MSDPLTGFEAIGLGLRPNDGLGDPPRLVGEKVNRMLAELFARIAELEAGGVVIRTLDGALAGDVTILAGDLRTVAGVPLFTRLQAIDLGLDNHALRLSTLGV